MILDIDNGNHANKIVKIYLRFVYKGSNHELISCGRLYQWEMISLNSIYLFIDDLGKIWSVGTWILKYGILHLSKRKT